MKQLLFILSFAVSLIAKNSDSTFVLIEELNQYWNNNQWENIGKTLVQFNAQNLKASEQKYGWDGTTWIENNRKIYSYNNSSQLINLVIIDSFIGWDTSNVVDYFYDQNNRVKEEIHKNWDYNDSTYWRVKIIYQYDNRDNIIEIISQQFLNNEWNNIVRTEYNFDINNNQIRRWVQHWENNVWVNTDSYNFIYNNGLKNKFVRLSWNSEKWDTLSKSLYNYNDLNLLIFENRQVKQNDVWIKDSQFFYEYDSLGNIVFHKFQYWHGDSLINGGQNIYEFNQNGSLVSEIEQGWRNNNWENNSKINYEYDNNGNLINKRYNNWMNEEWRNTVQNIYKYNTIVSVVNSTNVDADFTLSNNYPNPFNPTTIIEYSIPEKEKVQLIIFNSLGQEVEILVNEFQDNGFHKIIFNGNGLSSGIYFYQLKVGNKYQAVKKMLLIK